MNYLVDLGRLIPVTEVTAGNAFDLALLELDERRPGTRKELILAARVYKLDQDGRWCELGEKRERG
jgi:hypothetical protein